MKRLISTIAVVLGCALPASGAPPATLTTLHAIHALSHAEAAKGLPVAFEATVTYRRENETALFLQDGGDGLYVYYAKLDTKLTLGDRVLVRGTAQDSFRPIAAADSVTVLHHGKSPEPVRATFEELIRGEHDCLLVTVRATVLFSGLERGGDAMQLLVDGSLVNAYIDSRDANAVDNLLDAQVEVTGVAGASFDGKMQQTGVQLAVSSIANVKIINRAKTSPWSLPVTQMDQLVLNYRMKNLSQRVRVHGTITYYQSGLALVLQSGAKSVWIRTDFDSPLRVGDEADATGYPEVHEGYLGLNGGRIHESQVYAPLAPFRTTVSELAWSKHIFDLVSLEGRLVMEIRESSQDEYVLVSGDKIFSAVYRHPPAGGLPPPMKEIAVGSLVRITGICFVESSSPFRDDAPFSILMRGPEDISAVSGPSMVNTHNLLLALSLALAVVLAVSSWGWTLRRKVHTQTAALAKRAEAEAASERRIAQLEQRRSAILEDINKSRPLAETLQKIAEMVSFGLKGALCWTELSGDAARSASPPEAQGLRIVRYPIASHVGSSLGDLAVGFGTKASVNDSEQETLSSGARLAALAIETQRLYSDLRRRSEFDLLTDIHNRFSLEKRLNARIEDARIQTSAFGMIYVDLDQFKPVNDRHGHHIGDLYLRNVALRMKRQIRTNDTLARLGGDEFAVLVATVRDRAELTEIALRLERCFDEPFSLDGLVLNGAASVGIALYPQDGVTKDEILNAADAAMYEAKNAKRQIENSVKLIALP